MTAIYRLSVYSLVLPLRRHLHAEQAGTLICQTLASGGLRQMRFWQTDRGSRRSRPEDSTSRQTCWTVSWRRIVLSVTLAVSTTALTCPQSRMCGLLLSRLVTSFNVYSCLPVSSPEDSVPDGAGKGTDRSRPYAPTLYS